MVTQGSEDALRPMLRAEIKHAVKKGLLSERRVIEVSGIKIGIPWSAQWAIIKCDRG